jgi:ankyrin repeat protein
MDIFELSKQATDAEFDGLVNEEMLESHDINAIDNHQHTPLFYAIRHGNLKMTQFLLSHGATLQTNHYTAFQVACYFGHLQLANALYKPTSLQDRDKFGNTPLILASMKGHMQVCEWLLEQGADINDEDIHCQSAFYVALRYNHPDTAKLLLKNDTLITTRACGLGYYPITVALVEGYLDIAEELFTDNFDVNQPYTENNTLLHMCAMTGNVEVTKWLLDKHANPFLKNNSHFRPIDIAAARGHTVVFQAMLASLKSRVKKVRNLDLDLMLCLAASQGHHQIIEIIGGHQRHFSNICIQASLMFATIKGHEKAIDALLLLEPKKMSNLINKHYRYGKFPYNGGGTLLHAAADIGHLSTVIHLVAHGAKLNALNDNKDSVLHSAVKSGNVDLVRWLCNQRVYPNQTNKQGDTPLHIATTLKNEAMIRCLLLHGADSTIENKHRQTAMTLAQHHATLPLLFEQFNNNNFEQFKLPPLHIMATLKEEKGIMEMLPEMDNIHIQSEDGLTPIQLAACLGRNNPLSMLLLWNAKGDVSLAQNLALHMASQYHPKSTAHKTLQKSAHELGLLTSQRMDSFKRMIEMQNTLDDQPSQSSSHKISTSSVATLGMFSTKGMDSLPLDRDDTLRLSQRSPSTSG